MQFEETFDFDCDAATVMRMFSDRAYYLDKYRRLSGPEPELVGSSLEDGRFSITVCHILDVNDLALPDAARKLVGDRLLLRQTDSWQIETRTGRIDIELQSTAVNMTIDMHLVERDAGARLALTFDIRAEMPLIGKRIERALADPLRQRMRADLEETARMAADYR